MSYETLLRKRLIKSFKATESQIDAQFELADRDCEAAKRIVGTSNDWTFNIAYNAMLQATRALMFFEGFRPRSGEGQHKTTILFAEVALGDSFRDEIRFFEKMRVKRNRAVYDIAGLISETEARQAIQFAEKFIMRIKEHIK
jgi:uncharacterized protein (UPF0332 family)